MAFEDLALSPLPRVAYCIVAASAEQAEALPLPGLLVPQNIDMIAVILTCAKFPVTYRAAVLLRLVHLVPELLADGGALGAEELLKDTAH